MAKTYSEIDPKLREQEFVKASDAKRWAYCCRRFKEFWGQQGNRRRRIPMNHSDKDRGAAGWFFPAKWLRDFETLPKHEEVWVPQSRSLSTEERVAFFNRVIAPKATRIDPANRISKPEVERWQLPVGTRVSAFEVEYPDGTRETVDNLRLRHGKYHPGAPPQSAEQQNLEDMVRTLKRGSLSD